MHCKYLCIFLERIKYHTYSIKSENLFDNHFIVPIGFHWINTFAPELYPRKLVPVVNLLRYIIEHALYIVIIEVVTRPIYIVSLLFYSILCYTNYLH